MKVYEIGIKDDYDGDGLVLWIAVDEKITLRINNPEIYIEEIKKYLAGIDLFIEI